MKNSTIITAAIICAAGAALTFTGFNQAQSQSDRQVNTSFSDAQEDDIRKIVEAYIRDNPEVMIEALNEYAANEREESLARYEAAQREALPYLISDEGGYAAGPAPADATVAVVEFFDYHCGFCKRANGLVRDLTKEDPSVKVVFRELPILKQESEVAARYALASIPQGKYLDFHFDLMSASGTLTEDRVLKIAKKSGLDVDELKKAADAESVLNTIDRHHMIAEQIGVDGTPGFLVAAVDGSFVELIPGFDPQRVRAAIDAAKNGGSAQ